MDGNDAGTTIEAVGNVVIGDGSGTGFDHIGNLETGSNKVTLLDSGLSPIGGLTTVAAGGELEADNGVSLSSGDEITGEGTVDGNINLNSGTVSGNLTVEGELNASQASSGTVTPGFSPGVINVGDLTLGSTDVFVVEVDGTAGAGVSGGHDQTNVAASNGGGGTVTLGGATLSLSSASQLSLTAGTSITLIDNDGGDAVSGTFSGLPEGTVVATGGQLFNITYSGGDGNDVVLVARDKVQVEFELAVSEDGETVDGTTVPKLLVLGDLTNVPEALRTIDFSLTAGTATEGVSDDFTLGQLAPSTVKQIIIPAANYTTIEEFDLTDVNEMGASDPANAVLRINQDNLIEGIEGLSFNFTNGWELHLLTRM